MKEKRCTIMKIGYWMNSVESRLKGGVQYNNERIIKILESIDDVQIVRISKKNNTLATYLRNLFFLAYEEQISRCEYIFFDGFMPLTGKQKVIAIINDIMTVQGEVTKSLRRRIAMEVYFRLAKWKAHRIIAVSNATADAIMKRYKIERTRIRVIPPVIETPPSGKKIVHTKTDLPLKLVFIGANRSNKNILTLINSIRILMQRIEINLTLIGPYSDEDNYQLSLLAFDLIKTNVVRILSSVGFKEKYDVLHQSHFLVLPSFQEGFGMPCIEAFSVGLPVICSDIPVFREITNNYAEFFDPKSPASLAKTILEAWKKPFNKDRMHDIFIQYNFKAAKKKLEDLIE